MRKVCVESARYCRKRMVAEHDRDTATPASSSVWVATPWRRRARPTTRAVAASAPVKLARATADRPSGAATQTAPSTASAARERLRAGFGGLTGAEVRSGGEIEHGERPVAAAHHLEAGVEEPLEHVRAEDLGRRAERHLAAAGQRQEAVAEQRRQVEVVGRQHHGARRVVLEP